MPAECWWKLGKTAWREANWEVSNLGQGASAGYLVTPLPKPVNDSIVGGHEGKRAWAFSSLSFGCPF